MMSKIARVRKGEDLDFSFDRDGLTISGWTCAIEVRGFPGDTAILSRTITPTDSKWTGFLTQTETAALANLGLHYLIAKLSNTTTDEEEQKTKRFHVTEAWA